MNIAKQSFYKRVLRFFNERAYPIEPQQEEHLLSLLYDQYQAQKRGNKATNRIVITSRFIIDALAKALGISPKIVVTFLTVRRSARKDSYATALSHLEPIEPRSKASKGIIHLIGKTHKPSFKITQPNGNELTPATLARTKSRTSGFNVGYSPVHLQSSDDAVQRAVTSNGSPLVRDISNDRATAWRRPTPSKEKSHVYFDKPTAQQLRFDSEDQHFEFTITKAQILQRINAKRPVSQKQVMGQVSAEELIKELGAKMSEEYTGKIAYHWAHRQGWSLNGAQSEENLDPMTAGANYHTLFKVEAPIRKMLLEGDLNQVHVRGTIVFNQQNGLPSKITYRFSEQPEDALFVEVIIDPMDHRVPTITEHELACAITDLTFRPL